MTELILFGPQRLDPIVRPQLDRMDVGDTVVSITAGWQEREGEVEDMAAHFDRRVVDLGLHRRLDDVWDQDPSLFRAHRRRQDRLQTLQHLYRMRLGFAVEPARKLLSRGEADDLGLVGAEQESAIDAIRHLDGEHLRKVRVEHGRFESEWLPSQRAAVQRHRDRLAEILEGADAVAIAGGHVAVLLNRMRLFGLDRLLEEFSAQKPIVAWSAGAMALSDRIVLFHDSPPQGAGNAEVLDAGLGLYRGIVPLPSAATRLQLDDEVRVSLFARRFEPDLCLPLDADMWVRRVGDHWLAGDGGTFLGHEGGLEPWKAMAA